MCRNCFGRWSSNLYISLNENDWWHSARVTSPGQHKKPRKSFLALFSLLHWPAAGQANNMTEHILLSLPPGSRASQLTWQSTFTLLHWLFFTDFLTHISSCPLSTMRRAHSFYRPLVSGKSFFHHSSFLLNQRILGETNWIFSTPAFDFSILIPVLTTVSQLLLGLQHFNPCPDDSVLIPALSFISVFFFLRFTAQGFLL